MDFLTFIIVHGKGEQSYPHARIKRFVCHWLEPILDVVCFHSSQCHHGGVGAVYVLLKKAK
ncbi:hypothetical protein BTN49_2929 [Candidatus Enterovibrio escicola]|uniref:Smr domain-containing protein n=1 Tax=Candidatus Enterovibrio escicola TaxID=1927127 RepID=A0A2A5SZS5_9GAMM|nr:Smr/MutS family protein [Candidatus Enterovibrio escacola]PCS21390.1 hypothetical protein BTN49_2929 [Candidatus Enterovibrio escacola]